MPRKDGRKRKENPKEKWVGKKKESNKFRVGGGVVAQMEEVRGVTSIPPPPPSSVFLLLFLPSSRGSTRINKLKV